MQKINKSIVILNAGLLFLLLEFISYSRFWLFGFVSAFFIIFILSFWQINKRKLDKNFLNIFLSPFIFVLGAVLFFIFLVPQIAVFKHIYIILVSGLLFLYLHNLNDLFLKPDIYKRFTLENLSSHFNLLSVFLLFSSFYTFMFFPAIIFYLTQVLVILITLILLQQNFWANKIIDKKKRFFMASITLLMTELYLVLGYLPTGFYVNGIILTVVYYLLVEIARMSLLKELNAKDLRRKIIISFLALALIFITSRWN